jgi:hypothetical protein
LKICRDAIHNNNDWLKAILNFKKIKIKIKKQDETKIIIKFSVNPRLSLMYFFHCLYIIPFMTKHGVVALCFLYFVNNSIASTLYGVLLTNRQ